MTAASEPNCMVPMEMRLRKRKTTAPLRRSPTRNSLRRPLKASAALATSMAAIVLTRVAQMPRLFTQFWVRHSPLTQISVRLTT